MMQRPDLVTTDSASPPPGPKNAIRTLLRRAIWLCLGVAAAYAALILAWVMLNPRI